MIKIKLIVNADDFGYSKGVNLGIIEGYKNGIVTSTTLMTNMPEVDHAFKLAKENPGLGVGIHFVLTAGKPIAKNVPSLIGENGYFHSNDSFGKYATSGDIQKELNCQLEKFLDSGLTPTHIDSHHHVHSHEKVLPIVLKLAEKYKLPVRLFSKEAFNDKYKHIKKTDNFIYEFYGDDLSVDTLADLLKKYDSYDTVEMMCHPGFVDQRLLMESSYNIQRAKELDILTSHDIKNVISEQGIRLINYRDINNI
jgi:hypothetical protein